MIALTDIDHGNEDGTKILLSKGDTVPVSFPKGALKILKDSGSVGEAAVKQEEIDSRDARIKELETALAAAQAKTEAAAQAKTEAPAK